MWCLRQGFAKFLALGCIFSVNITVAFGFSLNCQVLSMPEDGTAQLDVGH